MSYLVLCMKLGDRLPGTKTIPDQIASNKTPYYRALEAADAVLRTQSKVDVSALEGLLEEMLAAQLLTVVEQASGATRS